MHYEHVQDKDSSEKTYQYFYYCCTALHLNFGKISLRSMDNIYYKLVQLP